MDFQDRALAEVRAKGELTAIKRRCWRNILVVACWAAFGAGASHYLNGQVDEWEEYRRNVAWMNQHLAPWSSPQSINPATGAPCNAVSRLWRVLPDGQEMILTNYDCPSPHSLDYSYTTSFREAR